MKESAEENINSVGVEDFRKDVLNDYRLANESRQASLIGRKEVLTGKAKFGIFGDGKEVAQLAMAKQFRAGDFRSGYYRDQTFMFAIDEHNLVDFFAQLYSNPDEEKEPSSAGRSMNGHFSTRSLNPDGSWKDLTKIKNSSSDISPTAAQMPRLVGLAWASKLFRNNPGLSHLTTFSNNGNEVAFGTIGDASTSEGVFFEAINAGGVLQIPMAVSVWDDGYGISVPSKYQTTKENISEILKGFERNEKGKGYQIYRANGWDYPGLCEMYAKGISICRNEHVPVLFHIQQITQPQGHSTSGSHERYKSKERLAWEEEFDCIKKMRQWMIEASIATAEECDAIEVAAKKIVLESRKKAWSDYMNPMHDEIQNALRILEELKMNEDFGTEIQKICDELSSAMDPSRKDIAIALDKSLQLLRFDSSPEKGRLQEYYRSLKSQNEKRFNSFLYSNTNEAALNIHAVAPIYSDDSPYLDGREVLQANFDTLFSRDPRLVAFGEDLGHIGDVNQGFAGLQNKFGEIRITDTGIREATIAGQGIGLALRGLRPIAEIQYLDYLLYALQILSDDLASLHYRTKGGQKAPVIIRTRGHRLEGIWHSGSPMGMIIHALRGINVCVPRNMVQAAGFYNTMLACDEPALIIECLNGYRLKERLPANLGEFRIPVGVPEVLLTGTDITMVTYGSCIRIAEEAIKLLNKIEISVELIDVQTLLPFDCNNLISLSLQKTGKLLIVDEDVPGGASAYILQHVLEVQNGFRWLDSAPKTLSAKAHRPSYGSDGDYFSKPSCEDVYHATYSIMNEYLPSKFPTII